MTNLILNTIYFLKYILNKSICKLFHLATNLNEQNFLAKSEKQGVDISNLCTFSDDSRGTKQRRPQVLVKQVRHQGEALILNGVFDPLPEPASVRNDVFAWLPYIHSNIFYKS